MLLLLQLISLSAVAFGQFFGGHPMAASPAGFGAFGNDESETLPISQAELAHLMAQSLASSSSNGYRRPPPRYPPHNVRETPPKENFESNFEAPDEGAGETPQQPEEEQNEAQNEGYGQQNAGEGAPYQQQEGQDDTDEADEPQQEYQQNNSDEGSGPNYQQEAGNYPESQSNAYGQNDDKQEEPQSAYYDQQRGSQFDDSSHAQPYGHESGANQYQSGPAYKEYENAVNPRGNPHYTNDYSYSGPGAGYSGHPGSETYLTYAIRSSPKSKRFRS